MPNNPQRFFRPARFKRSPFFIKLLILILIILAIGNFVQAGLAIQNWDMFQVYAAAPLPLYQLASGVLWGGMFTLAAVLLWLRRTVAVYLTGGLSILSIIVFWLERCFLQVDPSRWINSGFIILAQSVWIIFVFASLWFIHPEKEISPHEQE